MQKIVIDNASQLELLKTNGRIEVCDNHGTTIGYFVAAEEQNPALYEWAKTQLSDDELQRRKSNRGDGHTTGEVMNRLEAK